MEKTTTTTIRSTFDDVKRAYETALASGQDCGKELQSLATAVAYSVINKCIDPQRKTAQKESNSGVSPTMLALRRGIAHDLALLENTAYSAERATHTAYNADGDYITEILDKEARNALVKLMGETLSDGIDLVQTACLAILEQAMEHANGEKWLDTPYTVRRLSKRVYIRLEDSVAYREEETTPMQEVYRAVRKAVQDNRAVRADPKNGYTYVEDMTPDGLETIYYRLGKYADLGGYESTSHIGNPEGGNGYGETYTANMQTLIDFESIMGMLCLTERQATIIKLRMQGKGWKAIGTYLGVDPKNVHRCMRQVETKCEKIGFTPSMWAEMNAPHED